MAVAPILPSPSASAPVPGPEPVEQHSSLWHDAWLRLRKNRLAVFGLGTLIVVTVACLFGPLLCPYGYEEQFLDLGAAPPRASHWLGTDSLGRDLLVRMFYGGLVSLGVGLA